MKNSVRLNLSFIMALCFGIGVLCLIDSCQSGTGQGSHWTKETEVTGNSIGQLYVERTDPADTLFISQVRTGTTRRHREPRNITEEAMNCEDHIVLHDT